MDDPNFTPENSPSEPTAETGAAPLELSASEPLHEQAALWQAPQAPSTAIDPLEDVESRRRSFLHNLFILLSLTLAAFILTTWILVRVDSPFGALSTGPQEVVRAQLLALDHGDLRPAYDMFSSRYRGQVSFELWHELIVTHWRMFHGEVVHSEEPAKSGPGVSLEIYVRGADDKDYRARFLLIRTDGRWWIDDVHWAAEPDRGEFSRT
jgi:hypothetical protein